MNTKSYYGLGDLDQQNKHFTDLKERGQASVSALKKYINQPEYNRILKTYLLSDVERIVNVARSSIRDKERSGDLVYDQASNDYSPKKEYSIDDINVIRKHFKKGFFNGELIRPNHLPQITIAFSMFKGGVGKTTQATHLAAHCAIRGLKTLLIDLDPQASATFMFGYLPSIDISYGNTIYTALLEDPENIKEIIKPTHYSCLDIITSGLELQSADLLLPNTENNNFDKLGPPLLRLKKALQCVPEYDVIILDCAPNHAATTMNALTASNAIILPVSPNMLAYGSSIQFIQTLEELTSTLIYHRDNIIANNQDDPFGEKEIINGAINKLFRVLITNDPADSEAIDVASAIRALYGDFVLPRPMVRTIALSRASNDMGLLYDMKRSLVRKSKESFDRGISCMKEVNDDILTLISAIWGVKNG